MISVDVNTFNISSMSFALGTLIMLVIGGNLKRKRIALNASAFLLKFLSFLPLAMIVFIGYTRGRDFFSLTEYLTSFAAMLCSIFLFAMADYLTKR